MKSPFRIVCRSDFPASAIGQASTTSNKTTIIRSGTEIALANDALQIVIDANPAARSLCVSSTNWPDERFPF